MGFMVSKKKNGNMHAAVDTSGDSWLKNMLKPHESSGGGFALKKLSGKETQIIHYESYGWSVFIPIIPIFTSIFTNYMKKGMEVEMKVL